MRVNRKALEAEIRQLREQLAVGGHTTRKALNDYVQATREENKVLKDQLKKSAAKIEELVAAKEALPV